jgi:hypothetical protein
MKEENQRDSYWICEMKMYPCHAIHGEAAGGKGK